MEHSLGDRHYFLSILRFIIIRITVLRYAFKLLLSGLKNAKVINSCHSILDKTTLKKLMESYPSFKNIPNLKDIQSLFNDYVHLSRCYTSLFQGCYTNLLGAIPTNELVDKQEQKQLEKIFKAVEEISTEGEPFIDPLTENSPATELQNAVMRHTFYRIFGIELKNDESLILARYGSVSLAVKEFLQYCNSMNSLTKFELLSIHLTSFITRAALRHEKLTSMQTILVVLREKARLVGRITSIWNRTKLVVLPLYWNMLDVCELKLREGFCSEKHKKMFKIIMNNVHESDKVLIKSKASILSEQLFMDSIFVLVVFCEKLECNLKDQKHKEALNRLEENSVTFSNKISTDERQLDVPSDDDYNQYI